MAEEAQVDVLAKTNSTVARTDLAANKYSTRTRGS